MQDNKHTVLYYHGQIAPCGVFCGGCPLYTRHRKPCPGAEVNHSRCKGCKSFYLCCKEKGIRYCHQCIKFPCTRYRQFAAGWMKHGQDLIGNQRYIQEHGEKALRKIYNDLVSTEIDKSSPFNFPTITDKPDK